MDITILGSGDAFCSGGRFNTCLHLKAAGKSMLIDCGATSMLALNRAGVDRNAVSTILFTHFHGDHFAGLPFFLLDAMFVTKRTAPLLIAGPTAVRERTRVMTEAAFPGFFDAPRAFDLTFLEVTPDSPAMINGIAIAAFPAVHDQRAGPCQAYRFTHEDKVFAFSGDTAWTDALIPLSAGADVFLCECYTAAKKLANHLDWETIVTHRADLTAKRLVLTHMGPEMLAFQDAIPATRAFDGMEISI